jgi:hypothetical protein
MRMDFELVRRETANRVAAEAYARGRAEGRAEAAATPPPAVNGAITPVAKPAPKPAAAKRKPKPAPRVIQHLCRNVDPMSSHRGKVVIGADGKGQCDWCGVTMWAD